MNLLSGKFTVILMAILSFFYQVHGFSQNSELQSSDSQLNKQAAYDLIKRILPEYADRFIVEYIPQDSGRDVFELETHRNKIILRGNDGVSIASAFNYWLNHYAHCQVTWNGTNLNIPKPFPLVPQKIRKVTPYKYRYYFNYTTYTLLYWHWPRWQQEIDWMALHGINMPLAVQGQNIIWDKVYKSLGFTGQELDSFFTGPSWFIWFWMGNMDAWGGPLPKTWMTSHETLEKKILTRERELGMIPILQGFTGHVPPNFKDRYPKAKLRKTNWEGRFADTYILDPSDSMFTVIGKKFLQEEIKTYGTDHYYAADVFNEMVPPTSDSMFLNDINKKVYHSMADVDSQAIWVMQGWLFVDKDWYWKPTQIKALLNAVPEDKLLILDLFADEKPVWSRTDAFYGKRWIWCMLHNFGGTPGLFGNLDTIAIVPAETWHNPASGNMAGLGVAPEGIEQNPVIYDLMLSNIWHNEPIDLDNWLKGYVYARYGQENKFAEQAWDTLRYSVYNVTGNSNNTQSIITGRPTMNKSTDWTSTDIEYDPMSLVNAWQLLINASNNLKDNDGFQYDLVDVTRQVLGNYANVLQQRFAADYKHNDLVAFRKDATAFLDLISNMDTLLRTRKDFLLGPWLNDARTWGKNQKEKDLYEMNARDLITLWADKNSPLHEYAFRQWSGLLNDFYKPRWEQFISYTINNMRNNKKIDEKTFDENIKNWEWDWVNSHGKIYPDTPKGNPVKLANEMYQKYYHQIKNAYQNQ